MAVAIGNPFEESVGASLVRKNFVYDNTKPIHKTNRSVFKKLYFALKWFKNDIIKIKMIYILTIPPPPFQKKKEKKIAKRPYFPAILKKWIKHENE